MIPQSTQQQLRIALETFDRELRNQPEWLDWEKNSAHRYAIIDSDRRYPVKEIVSIATGVSKDQFKGGEESIRFVENLGLLVEALRLPTKANVKMAVHDLILGHDPQSVSKESILESVATRFALSVSARATNTWSSLVDQVLRELEEEQLVRVSAEQSASLARRSERRFWVEKTLVDGRSDRTTGKYALGKMLWSPQRDKSDGDTYRLMRFVQPGDVVFHLADNREIRGISTIASHARTNLIGIANTDWAGRSCYQIELSNYRELTPPITREAFLGTSPYKEQLENILEENINLFYNRDLDLNQGAYLTEAPAALVEVFNTIYIEETGKPVIDLDTFNMGGLVDRKRLGAAQLLFTWIFGAEGVRSEKYRIEERAPKEALLDKWNAVASIDKIAEAVAAGKQLELCSAIQKVINPSNLLPWRYSEFIRKIDDADAKIFIGALYQLLNAAKPDVTAFNRAIQPMLQSAGPEGALYAASSALPSLFLWFTRPDQEVFVRRESYDNMCKALRIPTPPRGEPVMTSEEYEFAKRTAAEIQKRLASLDLKDMIDVQSFCWRIFSIRKVWFGGKTYGGKDNKLPVFLDRKVFAVGFEQTEEVHTLLESAISNAATRDDVCSQIAKKYDSGAADALVRLIELASAKGSLILAKSAYYDSGRKESLLKVFAVGKALGGLNALSEELGHETPVDWLSEPNYVVPLGAFFPRVNSTLSSLTLDETLDLFSLPTASAGKHDAEEPIVTSAEPGQEAKAYTLHDFVRETGVPLPTAQDWLNRLKRKKQIVFQGPPGTGKTFIAEKLAKVLTSGDPSQTGFVQFHPTYGYEDFILGLRPQVTDAGGLSYDVQPGHFLKFCEEAEGKKVPYVFVIDEMNRANLSRVFGELMYLLEYRNSELLLAGREDPFKVPENVFLIGTMNTADRSIALVDHALRRRFSFVYLAPDYSILHNRLENDGLPAGLPEILQIINQEIGDRNYHIGISFFMRDGVQLKESLEAIWKGEIESYLEEYFYDKPEKVDAFRWQAVVRTGLQAWV